MTKKYDRLSSYDYKYSIVTLYNYQDIIFYHCLIYHSSIQNIFMLDKVQKSYL